MAKSKKTTKAEEKKADAVKAIVKPDAPFDVLKWGETRVGKDVAIEVPADITNHRHAEWLDFLS